MATRPCPYCAEEIQAEATVCRFCRSRLAGIDPARWERDRPERRIAGVAAAVAHGLDVPIGLVRLGFVVASFVHLIGVLVYAGLWLVIPPRLGEPALFERLVDRIRAVIVGLFGSGSPRGPAGPADHVVSGEPRA